jgi:hypothetical protein
MDTRQTLRQFDMAYAHSKAHPAEIDGISQEDVEDLVTEGRDIAIAFSDSAAKLSGKIRFHSLTPPENQRFSENRKWSGS